MSDIKCATCGSNTILGYLGTTGHRKNQNNSLASHYTSCPKCKTQIPICSFCYSHGWAIKDVYPWQETKLEEICEKQMGSPCSRDKKIDNLTNKL